MAIVLYFQLCPGLVTHCACLGKVCLLASSPNTDTVSLHCQGQIMLKTLEHGTQELRYKLVNCVLGPKSKGHSLVPSSNL